jgi:uncharacterized protein (TIGR03437 family)
MKRLFVLAVLACPLVPAQTPAQIIDEPVVLTIDVENTVIYRGTVFDASKIAKDPGPTTSVNQAFVEAINLGDIVAINGKPVKGIWSSTVYATPYRANPQPGQPIADFDLAGTNFCTWQIYDTDGAFLGMIRDSGAGQGHTVVGSLAGFFGAIGAHQGGTTTVAIRQASTGEDPANRRILGGGKMSVVFYLYPRVRPAIVMTNSGPSVSHTDYSPVTNANPARPGETLILAATGLGPVKPDLLPPGAVAFSGPPYQEVNAPVTVAFNGKELPVTNKFGWPGQKTVYWIDFQVPADTPAGTATLGLISTWIPGPMVSIPVGSLPMVK